MAKPAAKRTRWVRKRRRSGMLGRLVVGMTPINDNPATKETETSAALPLLIPASRVARLLSISVRQVWNLHQSGTLGPMPLKLQGRSLWRTDELMAWVRHNCPNRGRWVVIWKSN